MKHPLRTWFKDEILAEFFPPYLGDETKTSTKAIIFCDGLPSLPGRAKLLGYWSKRGYWVFNIRYRGTWESKGVFLDHSPHQDVLDVIDDLKKGIIMSMWDMSEYDCSINNVFVIGVSFGGPAAILAASDKNVKKAVAISPVVDWLAPSEDCPIEEYPSMVERAFGEGYRARPDLWKKLQSGSFYSPKHEQKSISGNKVMIIHAADDTDVRAKEVGEFADVTGSRLFMLKKGGHLGSSLSTKWLWSRRIEKFFNY